MTPPLLDTFPLSSSLRKRAERALGLGSFRRVNYKPIGPLGHCYWTVDDHVSRYGGKMVLGWQITWWPALFVEAMHHAIWELPSGEEADITRKPETDRRSFTTFVDDTSIAVPLDKPTYIPNKYLPLVSDPSVDGLIRASLDLLTARREFADAAFRLGGTWQRNEGIRVNGSALPALKELMESVKAHENRVVKFVESCHRITH